MKMNRVLKIIFEILCFSVVAKSAPAIWDGTADTTWFTGNSGSYEINTAEQLAGLAKMVNEGTQDFEAIKITLGADIFLNDTIGAGNGTWKNNSHRNWNPIRGFKGNFDGSDGEINHKIYGLYVNSDSDDVGLFGSANARISNLDILVGNVSGNNHVGALIGFASGGSVANVHVEINVNGASYVGGVVGRTKGSILSCSVNASIYGKFAVGGVAGEASGLIELAYHVGGEISGRNRVGGLVGTSTSSISKSYSEGDVTGISYVGGLVGYGRNVSNSYVKGMVKSDSSYVGGIAGYMMGTIDSSYHIGGDISGFNYVGGLVGYTLSSIRNSYSEGNVIGLNNYVGGVIGGAYYRYNASVDSMVTVLDNSYAIGNVKGNIYVGGLIGQDSIYRTENKSKRMERIVRESHSQGNVEGNMYIGGVVGKSCHGAKDSTYNRYFVGKIVSSYHSDGDVIGISNYVGGIAGYTYGIIDSSHHMDGDVIGLNYVGGVTGYTDSSITNSSFKGNVNGRSYVGGIVGDFCVLNNCSRSYKTHNISKSYVTGAIQGTSDYVGGLAGRSSGMIDSSYHMGGDVRGARYVGGLTGYTVSPVTNSFSEGDVLGTKTYIGGLVGFLAAVTGNSNVVSKCYVKGSIKGDSSYVGGIAGIARGLVDSSYHVGGDVVGAGYVGGLAGYISSSVENSYSEGNVHGKQSYVGGLVGYGDGVGSLGIISASHAKGTVKSDSNYVGGIVGYAALMSVDSSYHISGNVNGISYAGGLVGYTTSFVTNSYSEGDVIGVGNNIGGLIGMAEGSQSMLVLDNSYASGDIKGYDYIGGLIGQDSITHYDANISIRNSYSQGNIEGNMYVGGVIGKLNDMGLSNRNSTFIGQIVSSGHSDGDVTGMSNYVGGVAGYFNGFIDSCYYVVGNVAGYGDYVGGLVGLSLHYFDRFNDSSPENISTLSNSYVVGNVKGANYVGGLVGLDSVYVRYSSTNVGRYIHNSHSQGTIDGKKYVGGLVGKSSYEVTLSSTGVSKKVSGMIISSYHSDGDVIGTSDYVGGIAGYIYESVDSCYHTFGNVGGASYVGGLAGKSSLITNSYSEGDVVGTKSYVGGLVGSGEVSKSYAKGSVRSDSSYVGGVAGEGKIDSTYHIGGNISGAGYVGGLAGKSSLITNSYSEGDVVGTKSYVGGLVGFGEVSKSYAKGAVRSGSSYVGGIAGGGSIDSSYHIGGSISGAGYVGGLAGYSSSITNSYSEGDVFGTESYVGGLAGYVSGKGLLKSYSEGFVKGDSSYVGGVVGYVYGRIDSSYHVGGDIIGVGFVGGLVGYISSSVENSYSEGDVAGTKSYVGGLIGYGGSVSQSYAKGSVRGDSNYVGGIVGYARYSSGGIDSVYHTEGDVIGVDYVGGVAGYSEYSIANSHSDAFFVKGANMVGGLVGQNKENVVSSYFAGNSVIGNSEVGGLVGYVYNNGCIDNSYSIAHIKGFDNVGGLVGSVRGDVSNSYATGNVVGDMDSPLSRENIGGLIGYQVKGSVSKSFALGDVSGDTKLGGLVGRFDGASISQSYANGNVDGKYHIGGLVGYGKGSMDEIYASGVVKSVEDRTVYTGCIVGYVNGSLSVTKSYYDKSKCNLGIDGGENIASVTGNPAKMTEEMQTQSTFVDWDFTNTWRIEDNTYPFMQIYANSLINAVVLTEPLEGFEYDGLPKTPQVKTVTLYGGILTKNVDYAVKYEKNVNAGTARISVCGLNLYGGCKTVEFEIAPKAIQPTISAIGEVVYTGLTMTPEISVYNGETLLETSDYTVEYSDNVNVGTASVAITMKGNYSGTAIKTFTIGKANPVISQNPSASDITVGSTLALSNLANGSANVPGSFAWKNPEIIPTLENTGYEVVFTPNDAVNYNSVEITVPVKVWDIVYVAIHVGERTLDSVVVIKGTDYTLPIVPDSIGYDFAGFFLGNSVVGFSGDVISVSENTVIDAKYSIKIFAVNFVNDGTELQSDSLPYGSLPEYIGSTPIKAASAKYTYTFKGWNPAIETVSKSATYTAVFDSVVNKYVITFVDGNTVLQSSEVEYGTLPTPPTVSLPENTAQYTYSFGGWDRDVVAVTGATTYSAIINQTVNKYSVVFKDYNGTILKNSVKYNYGTFAADIVKPANPIRSSSAQYAYTFKGWSPTISEVTKDEEYVAEYDSTLRNYTIAFVSESETLQSTNVDYGVVPTYDGAAPIKAASAKYTYTFKGWSPAVSNVIGDAVYTALYDSTLRTYAIAFVNGSETLQSSEFGYGTIPSYKGTVPTKKETKEYTYTFKGWNPTITAVTGKATYKALFDSTLQKYTVVFKNGNDKLQTISVAYGETPKYTGKTPTKKSTNDYSYEFVGWSPKLGPVAKETEFVAVFDSTKVTGIQNARLASSNMSVNAVARSVQITAAPVGSAYAIFDMQGRVLKKGVCHSANFNIPFPHPGKYLVRVGAEIEGVQIK